MEIEIIVKAVNPKEENMKITDEMLPFIEMAMDYRIKKAYPKTGGVASLRAKVTMATLKGLEQQKESLLSRALFFAAQAANKACSGFALCSACGESLAIKGSLCEECALLESANR